MSTNEAADQLRYNLAGEIDADSNLILLDAGLAVERSAAIEQLAANDEHWHRGPGASCSICRFGAHERSAGAAPLDVEALANLWREEEVTNLDVDCSRVDYEETARAVVARLAEQADADPR